jgi:hypothetical protein
MNFIAVAACVSLAIFMFGAAFGARQSRNDYEPLIESLMRLVEKCSDVESREEPHND